LPLLKSYGGAVPGEGIVGFQGGYVMNGFRQLWNGVWHYQEPQDETIRWIVQSGLGELICFAIILVPVLLVFLVLQKRSDRIYRTKPREDFEIRHAIVEKTGNFLVYDMSDEELEALHDAEIDF
jgi:hypothetical protein